MFNEAQLFPAPELSCPAIKFIQGVAADVDTLKGFVIVKLLELLSITVLLCNVSNCVFVIAVKVEVGGVKFDV
jgi:hypothetical protein